LFARPLVVDRGLANISFGGIEKKMKCKNILVVEDDHDIREALEDILRLEGFEIRSASNGKEAIELLDKIESPCLILLDLMMPVMNGWEFIHFKDKDVRFAPIPVVVVSAVADRGHPIEAKELIKKPINLDVLLEVVNQYCRP
jgi:CheY-like chemotaxis protein